MKVPFAARLPLELLLDPEGETWGRIRPETLSMMGTPLGLQPTGAIRSAWMNRTIGVVTSVAVSAVHTGEVLAFRLEWKDATENRELGDTNVFPDAAAVLLPSVEGAPLMTMGAPGAPVTAWYWRADDDGGGRQLVAEGIGTSRTPDQSLVRGHGVWKNGVWRVVIGRPLRVQSSEPFAQLEAGRSTRFGVAVWEGSNGERGGIKAFSGDWHPLELEPAGRS